MTYCVACSPSSAAELTPSSAPKSADRGAESAGGGSAVKIYDPIACVVVQLVTSHLFFFFLDLKAHAAVCASSEFLDPRAFHVFLRHVVNFLNYTQL